MPPETDGPDWFERPPDVGGVTVCRVSGKLPGAGCSNVQVVTTDGWTETRSMLYTEFFRKGTQPTSICPIHSASFADTLVTSASSETPRAVGDEPAPPASPAATTGRAAPEPQAPAARPADVPRDEARPPEPQKKRGFWSKVFGIDRKNDKKKDEKKKPGGG